MNKENNSGFVIDMEVKAPNGIYKFTILPLIKNGVQVKLLGQTVYKLVMSCPSGKYQYNKQHPNVDMLKMIARNYADGLLVPSGGVDFTKEWKKVETNELN